MTSAFRIGKQEIDIYFWM